MKIFAGILIVLVVVITALLFYQGVFHPVKLKEQVIGDYWLVYQGHVGPYENVGPVIEKICRNLNDDGIETKLSFGIYYDDPRKVERAKLRSEVGAILDPRYYDKVKELQTKYNLKQLKERNSLVAELPLKNVLSYMIGPMKVYPAMEKYCKENNIDVDKIEDGFGMEIYDTENKKITYIMPLEEVIDVRVDKAVGYRPGP